MTEQELYDIPLHELKVNERNDLFIRRVIGGWIYTALLIDKTPEKERVLYNSVFVPEPKKRRAVRVSQ